MRSRTNITHAARWLLAVLVVTALSGAGLRYLRDNGPGESSVLAGPSAPVPTHSPAATVRPSGTASALTGMFDPPPAYPGYPWTRDGKRVSEFEFETIAGPEHCGWQSATMLFIAWPPGTVSKTAAEARQYIRDPRGVIQGRPLLRQLELHATLPTDAKPTGYRYGPLEVYLSPSDQDQFIYVVGLLGVERWPRSDPMTLCV